jgi:hypothetical protein
MKKIIIILSITIFIIAILHLFNNTYEPYESYATPYIWQSSIDDLSEKEETARETWISNNPGWKCELYDEEAIDKYMKRYWSSITRPPMKSELWRYLILKTHGGVYSDMNTECLKPITDWEEEQNFVSKNILVIQVADDKISKSTIYSTKEHPVMKYVCEYILNNYDEEKDYLAWEEAILEFLKEEGLIFKDYKANPGVFHDHGIYLDFSKSLTRKAF